MPSSIAWLDASTDEQRRMREIIKLFTEKDSRDELGVGSIRDGLSDILFPGTSVVLTRARYLLFVPWCYEIAARKSGGREMVTKLQYDLIRTMRATEDGQAGLIGIQAGEALQNLPSTIYWTTLRSWGILTDPDVVEHIRQAAPSFDDATSGQGASGAWSATMPSVPADFPKSVAGGFRLEPDEAGWLHDRILEAAPGTLLAHLADVAPADASEGRTLWDDPSVRSATSEVGHARDVAHRFSVAHHGAQLLYNLLIAEDPMRRRAEGEDDFAGAYTERLAEWQVRARDAGLADWDERELWQLLASRGVRVPERTRAFVSAWASMLRHTSLDVVASNDARQLIRERERSHKGALARLGNPSRLATWGGAAGSGQLSFRWETVRRILLDIHEGMADDARA